MSTGAEMEAEKCVGGEAAAAAEFEMELQAVVLSGGDSGADADADNALDGQGRADLDQATFFRCVDQGNHHLLQILLRRRNLDINAYNDQGMTALHLAVYKYETSRKLDVTETLIKNGADVCLRAAAPPQANKISVVRHDARSPGSDGLIETKKISLDKKTPLLLALELKSALYLRGWEYRHWDSMLQILAEATCQHYAKRGIHEPITNLGLIPDAVQKGWNAVFQSGKHEVVVVCAEGKEITALKLLLTGASKILKTTIENVALINNSNVLEIKDASFTIVRAIIEFLYTGVVDTELMSRRGIDILVAAHKYAVESLKKVCEERIHPTQEEWIKLLNAALDCESDVLYLKCANSIKDVMHKRQESTHMLRKSFSEHQAGPPHQLFHGSQSHHHH